MYKLNILIKGYGESIDIQSEDISELRDIIMQHHMESENFRDFVKDQIKDLNKIAHNYHNELCKIKGKKEEK